MKKLTKQQIRRKLPIFDIPYYLGYDTGKSEEGNKIYLEDEIDVTSPNPSNN
ncbi:MAG: hypothetical protein J6T72_04010 [Alphaproteobacteria bacterium]|nr:hypothetical protein [Alphaproteobacteria bacterium]